MSIFTLSHSTLFTALFLAVFSALSHEETPMQEQEVHKTLALKVVLEQGMREHPEEKIRAFQDSILEIDQKNNFDHAFVPHIGFSIKTDNQRIHNFYSGDALSTSSRNPMGYAGIEVDNYSVFNWGKDYLRYKMQDETLQRQRSSLDEKRSELKLDLIAFYFQLVGAKHQEAIARDFIRHASYIYRLAKEQSSNQKIRRGEYLQARSLYLWAQQNYYRKRREANSYDRQMAVFLGDPSNTVYTVYESLDFKKMHYSADSAQQVIEANNRQLKEQKVLTQNAERNYQLATLEMMPLPQFTFNLGGYTHTFNGSSGGKTDWSTNRFGPGGKNLELRASINLTWTFLGEGGLFNLRGRDRAFYQFEMEKTNLQSKKNAQHNQLQKIYYDIRELEREWDVADPLLVTSRKKFDQMLDQFMERKGSFLDLKEAIFDLKETEEWVENLKIHHLSGKLGLAQMVGLDDFPGENFENLALEAKNAAE